MKQLEIEYKNAISLEVPDLWIRIEAGIDEYESSKVKEEKKVIKFDHKKVIAYAGRFSAAAVCLLLAMGAFKLVSGGDKAANMATSEAPMMSDSAATYTASEECCEPAAAEEYMTDSEMEADDSFDSSYSMSEAASEATAEDNYEFDRDAQKKINAYQSETDDHKADSIAVYVVPVVRLKRALDCDDDQALMIIRLLPKNGIKGAYDFMLAPDDEPDSEAVKEIEGIGDDTIRISFVDEEESRYLMYCNRNIDETVTVLAVIREDGKIFEILP